MGVDGRGDPQSTDGGGADDEPTLPLSATVPGQGGPSDEAAPVTPADPGGGDDTEPSGGGDSTQPGGGPSVPQQRAAGGKLPGGELPDSALVARMRGGDTEAYDELYRRHSEAVRRYARTCCRDSHTADDLTNEVFARTLQAVRGGSGPDTAVRAYLLTSVRRVAAAWTKTAKREQLVEDFAVFAQSAAHSSTATDEDTQDLGADVRAMREADRSLAVQAFRSLPEKYQTVLWHTTVEDESPKDVAPLLGLSDNATAVLAHRAREKLKQAYLQAHVSHSLTAGGDCARYADRLGAYARGGLRMRAERGLRKHLEECAKCRTAALEVKDLNSQIRILVPVAFIGWFGAAGGAKAFGALLGGGSSATAAAGAGAAAAASGSAGTGAAGSGGAAGGAASEGLGTPAKVGIAVGAVTAAAVAAAMAMTGNDAKPEKPEAKPPAASQPPEKPAPGAPPPGNKPDKPAPAPPEPAEPEPKPKPKPEPEPEPKPKPPPEPEPEPSKPPVQKKKTNCEPPRHTLPVGGYLGSSRRTPP
ncbi:RNA polymerase subunit sigma-24 [Streptomyces armeniacus]|uniref:RNA polymerase subunit sigma-24 n=1 Tax=Streptomyces armeniacus TaxID=83291 RepID=A0A345XYX8_9ACTN|nr:RNA polymerase subunit sigma-24 [Streptomyces armeniacus]